MSHCVGLLLNYRDSNRSIRCVHSLFDNGISQVFVWDNSADGGRSAAEIDAAFAGDDRVAVRVSAENLGFASGVNRGFELCLNRNPNAWIVLINNDARLLGGALQKLQTALSAKPMAKIAVADINHAGNVRGAPYYHRASGLMSWKPSWGSFQFATGCCLLVATDRISGPLFDEDFFMYGEDVELGWRLAQLPDSLVHIPETLVEHDGSASSGLGSSFYESHVVAGHLMLASKLAKGSMGACLFSLARVPILAMRAIVRAFRYRSAVPVRALWTGLCIARNRTSRAGRRKSIRNRVRPFL